MKKAVGLLSGGLDSTLAAKLMLEQGIEVFVINFTSPFCTCTPKNAGCAAVITAVRELGGIPLRRVAFEPTIPEKEGWVDKSRLLGMSGRSRRPQISLAAEKGIRDYPCPAGGCLLTDKDFAHRMRDYFRFTPKPSVQDIPLLKVGRHFRLHSGEKVIVARNEHECNTLKRICPDNDHLLRPANFSGPVVVFQGKALGAAVEKMLAYTKRRLPEDASVTVGCDDRSKVIFLRDLWPQSPTVWAART